MRNRWHHRPLLHSPALGKEKRATWLELFFDLIFVAAFIQLGNGLSEHVTFLGAAAFVGAFVPLWVAWTGFTFFVNRFTVDDFVHRNLVLLQMFAVGGMAISAPGVLDGDLVPFSLAAAAAQGVVALLYLRAWPLVPEAREYSRYWGVVFASGAVLWALAACLPDEAAIACWALGTVVVLASPLSRQSRELSERFPIDFEHLGERYGLLTIIVLGESFVKVLSALASESAGIELYIEAGAVLLLTCGVWWIYFDDVAGSKIRSGPGKWVVWLYAHIPLQLGITAMGVAIKKSVHFSWDAPAPDAYRWLLAGSVATVFLAVAAIDSVCERRQAELSDRARVNFRWISGIVLLVLAPAGRTMSGGLFLLIVMAINVAQVFFDMMMAPFESAEHLELGQRSINELARERLASTDQVVRRPRTMIGDAVRKGTPAALRRDMYFYLIEGSWLRVFAMLGFVFLISNVFFAALFTLDPGGISNLGADTFMEAFFFSVQTMSTIGYGTLSPLTAYSNAIVTAEAALSIVGVALVTGLVFAKVSRPHASVLFSKAMVLTSLHGKRVLMFRAGNARGNDIVDASMNVTLLIDDISPEGHHMRRLVELPLVRSRSPLFMLSWLVMHEVDEQSPLADVDWSNPEKTIVSLITTLVGHDGTYGQTVYARHVYYGDDLKIDHRFIDVISELPDGRLMIDYTRFHDTESELALDAEREDVPAPEDA